MAFDLLCVDLFFCECHLFDEFYSFCNKMMRQSTMKCFKWGLIQIAELNR
jgi:hypothetical protein